MRAILAAAALLAVPATPAAADTITRNGTTITVTTSGAGSSVEVVPDGQYVRIRSTQGATTPPDCTTEDNEATCPAPALVVVDFSAGGKNQVRYKQGALRTETRGGPGDDTVVDESTSASTFAGGAGTDTISYETRAAPVTVTLDDVADDGQTGEGDRIAADVEAVTGGSAADKLTGGPGPNTLTGGAGDDELFAQDGAVDTLGCGDGNDVVHVDADDVVAGDCERTVLPVPSPTPSPTPSPSPTPAARPSLAVKKPSLSALRKRGLPVTLTCAKACAATGRLTAGKRTIGRVSIGLTAAGSKTVRLRLSKAGRKRVRGKRKLKVTLVLTVVPSGEPAVRLKKTLKLSR